MITEQLLKSADKVRAEEKERAELRATYQEQVSGPGKFEGEAAYVPYFWEHCDNGDAWGTAYYIVNKEDSEHVLQTVYFISPNKEDQYVWPEIRSKYLLLWEDDNGFVYCKGYNSLGGCNAHLLQMAKSTNGQLVNDEDE